MSNGGPRKTTSADYMRDVRDRDVHVDKHRRNTPAAGMPVEVHDENSGAIDQPELRADFRAQRPPLERIALLEVKADAHQDGIDDANESLAIVHKDLGDLKTGIGIVTARVEDLFKLGERQEALRHAEISAEQARAKSIIEADEKRRAGRAKFWIALAKVMVTAITAIGVALAAYSAAKSSGSHPPAAVDK